MSHDTFRATFPVRPMDVPAAGADRPDPGRALFGTPDPRIGTIRCAFSDVAPDGTSLRDTDRSLFTRGPDPLGTRRTARRGQSIAGRIATTIFMGGMFGAVTGVLAGMGAVLLPEVLGSRLPEGAGAIVFSVVCAPIVAAFMYWFWRRSGPGQFEALCEYVGSAGLHRVEAKGPSLTDRTALYADAAALLYGSLRYVGAAHGVREGVVLLNASWAPIWEQAGWYAGSEPDADTLLVREIVATVAGVRTKAAEDELRRGGTLTFPIFGIREPSGRMRTTGQSIHWTGSAIELRLSGRAPLTISAGDVESAAVTNGKLRIATHTSPAPLEVPMGSLGDGEVLLALLRTRGAPGFR